MKPVLKNFILTAVSIVLLFSSSSCGKLSEEESVWRDRIAKEESNTDSAALRMKENPQNLILFKELWNYTVVDRQPLGDGAYLSDQLITSSLSGKSIYGEDLDSFIDLLAVCPADGLTYEPTESFTGLTKEKLESQNDYYLYAFDEDSRFRSDGLYGIHFTITPSGDVRIRTSVTKDEEKVSCTVYLGTKINYAAFDRLLNGEGRN